MLGEGRKLSRRLRILITARDPGAARALLPVIRYLSTLDALEVVCAAQEPGATVLRDLGIELEAFEAPILFATSDNESGMLIDRARELLVRTAPDAVITGLSGPGIGIDEAILAVVPLERSYSVQDFDGWVPEGFRGSAATYFVRCKSAAKTTMGRSRVQRCVVIGDSRQGSEVARRADWRRARNYRRRHLSPPVTIFFGQPLWLVEGYWRTIRKFVAVRTQCPRSTGSLIYCPHPKEEKAYSSLAQRLFATATQQVDAKWQGDYLSCLMAVDRIVTCYSSAGEEAFQLAPRRVPPRECLYLLYDREIRQYYLQNSGGSLGDLVTRPHQRLVISTARLRQELSETSPVSRLRYVLTHPKSDAYAPHLVYETIAADAAGWLRGTVDLAPLSPFGVV